MTTTSAHAFRARIERLRGLDRASFDEEVRAASPLWLAVSAGSEAAIPSAQNIVVSCGNDGLKGSPQVQY